MSIIKTALVSLLLFITSHAIAINEEQARGIVEGIGNEAIKILKIPVDDRIKRNNEFRTLLQEKFNMVLIGKAILGKSVIKTASDDQIEKFVKTLEEHVVKVYTSQLGVYKGQVFSINDIVIKKSDAFVYTSIDAGDTTEEVPTTKIVWRLRESNSYPKVIDIAVEGVSLLRTKRADFKVLLDTVGLEGLISKLIEINNTPDPKIPGE